MSVRSLTRAVLGSWVLQGLGWFALRETAMRMALEGGLVLVLLVVGITVPIVLASWIVAHSMFWFFLYGGYSKIGSLRGRRTSIPRLIALRDEIGRRLRETPRFRAAVLCGSGARNELSEHSDIDILVVPAPPFPRAILALWSLRASAVVGGLPLEVFSVDVERCLPFRTADQSSVQLKAPPKLTKRNLATGILVSLSGIDGSGKTTVARSLIERLHREGIFARYFYGHRPFFREGDLTVSGALLFKGIWHRIGRSFEDLRRHRRLALVLGLLTVADYIMVQLRILRLLQPNSVLIVDRYVADVIVYIRDFGPRRQSVEGLLTAVSVEPDVALLFEIDPAEAHSRKAEESQGILAARAQEYGSLIPLLGLVRIDARGSVEQVSANALAQIGRALEVPPVSAATAPTRRR